MTTDWRDRLAGARMQVDQQFQDRLAQSRFSSQEWGLIMTAVEFDVENPGDPDSARLVADTSHLDEILPELDRIQGEMGRPDRPASGSDDGGLLARIAGLFGSDDGDGDDERLAAARELSAEYATELQTYLEGRGRWEEIRNAAQESASG